MLYLNILIDDMKIDKWNNRFASFLKGDKDGNENTETAYRLTFNLLKDIWLLLFCISGFFYHIVKKQN